MKRLFILGFICLTSISARSQQDCVDCALINPDAICFTIWDPVCGCDGVTYSNDCVAMNSAGVTYWEQGECPNNNVSICSDLAGVDFGACDMVLGIAVVNGECITVSGCSTTDVNGVDYSWVFTVSQEFCEQNCLCGGINTVHESESIGLRVNPNPFFDRFQLTFHSLDQLNLHISNIEGREVMSLSVKSNQWIEAGHLDKGVYFLSISSEGRLIRTLQLIKTDER